MSEMLKDKALTEIPDIELCIFDSEDDYSDDVCTGTQGSSILRHSMERGHSVGLIGDGLSRSFLPADANNLHQECTVPSIFLASILFHR
jgi:hypothetical protein